MKLSDLLSLVFATFALLTSAPVFAQQSGQGSGPMRFEGHATLSTREGIGGGLRLELPVLPQGAIPNLNDDISVTAGADAILFWDDDDHYVCNRGDCDDDEGLGIWPMVAVQWNFYLGKEWSVFPELGLWLQLGEDGHGHDDDIDIDLMLGVGVRYHLGGRSALLLRLEHPGLVHIGVQF